MLDGSDSKCLYRDDLVRSVLSGIFVRQWKFPDGFVSKSLLGLAFDIHGNSTNLFCR